MCWDPLILALVFEVNRFHKVLCSSLPSEIRLWMSDHLTPEARPSHPRGGATWAKIFFRSNCSNFLELNNLFGEGKKIAITYIFVKFLTFSHLGETKQLFWRLMYGENESFFKKIYRNIRKLFLVMKFFLFIQKCLN